jgi:hypothetical protein
MLQRRIAIEHYIINPILTETRLNRDFLLSFLCRHFVLGAMIHL